MVLDLRYRQSLPSYYKSFSEEIEVVKDRVRNIIGPNHWASDGSHKEAVLKEILSKFLPSEYEISSGFIVDDEGKSSKQIDIIIYKNSSPVLFRSPDFVIIPREYVKAIIEVKTDLGGRSLISALNNLYSAQKIMNKSSQHIHTAIFAYDYNRNVNRVREQDIDEIGKGIFDVIFNFYRKKETIITEEFLRKYSLSALCVNQKLYGLNWNGDFHKPSKFGIYKTKQDSFNFFVSNLLNSLDMTVNASKTLWYPSEKESRVIIKEPLCELNKLV